MGNTKPGGVAARLERLRQQIVDLQEVAALQNVADLLKDGIDPKAIMEVFNAGLTEIGRMYQAREYYMTALVLAGELVREALQVLMPHLLKQQVSDKNRGLVIIGTIEGDIHDLGKNMAGNFLKAYGFEVLDLGVDVAPRVFLAEALKRNPIAVGVSLLLTTCVESVKRLAGLMTETYQGQLEAPLLFVGCGFLRHNREDRKAFRDKSLDWLGVSQVVTDVNETLKLCLTASDANSRPDR